MNAETYNSGQKLLTKVVPDSSAVETIVLSHNAEPLPGELDTIEEIHTRAETVTSLLKSILDYQPATHWGVND